jgi:hypothetical protein
MSERGCVLQAGSCMVCQAQQSWAAVAGTRRGPWVVWPLLPPLLLLPCEGAA